MSLSKARIGLVCLIASVHLVTPSLAAAQAPSIRSGSAAKTDSSIVVNGTVLSAEVIRQLQQLSPVPIPPGRYWYDPISGGYGREGEPIAGQMLSGLPLGGTLAPDASRTQANPMNETADNPLPLDFIEEFGTLLPLLAH